MAICENDYYTYMNKTHKKWQIKDNKIICMQLINKSKFKKNPYCVNIVKLTDINQMVKGIMKKEKCGELEATIKLKEQLKAKQGKIIDNNWHI